MSSGGSKELDALDVVVVGGGVSGTYSAWRLQETVGKQEKIALYEYSNRIGGRLYSRTLPGLPNVVAELGGMRYIPEDSSLPKDDPVHADNNVFYLRGEYFRYRDFAENPGRVPYRFDWSERGYGPENLQVKVMDYLHPGFADMSLCEQMKVKVFGKEIWKFGFWNCSKMF